jgi:hypothetical protein
VAAALGGPIWPRHVLAGPEPDTHDREGPGLFLRIDLGAEYSMGFKLDAEQAIVCYWAVNVKSIAEAVSTRIHLLSHQQKGAAL